MATSQEGGGEGVPKWVWGLAIGVPVVGALVYILCGPEGGEGGKKKKKGKKVVEEEKVEEIKEVKNATAASAAAATGKVSS